MYHSSLHILSHHPSRVSSPIQCTGSPFPPSSATTTTSHPPPPAAVQVRLRPLRLFQRRHRDGVLPPPVRRRGRRRGGVDVSPGRELRGVRRSVHNASGGRTHHWPHRGQARQEEGVGREPVPHGIPNVLDVSVECCCASLLLPLPSPPIFAPVGKSLIFGWFR
jgi:hypothetical protein